MANIEQTHEGKKKGKAHKTVAMADGSSAQVPATPEKVNGGLPVAGAAEPAITAEQAAGQPAAEVGRVKKGKKHAGLDTASGPMAEGLRPKKITMLAGADATPEAAAAGVSEGSAAQPKKGKKQKRPEADAVPAPALEAGVGAPAPEAAKRSKGDRRSAAGAAAAAGGAAAAQTATPAAAAAPPAAPQAQATKAGADVATAPAEAAAGAKRKSKRRRQEQEQEQVAADGEPLPALAIALEESPSGMLPAALGITADAPQRAGGKDRKRKRAEVEQPAAGEAATVAPDSRKAQAAAAEQQGADAAAAAEPPTKKRKKKQRQGPEQAAEAGAHGAAPPPVAAATQATLHGNTAGAQAIGEAASDVAAPQAEGRPAQGGGGRPERKDSGGTAGRAFQRVKDEEWLGQRGSRSNRYEDTFGSSGWGAKASEKLLQVRGKDFRHEKTKKKRGTYRGGAIDNAVNSFKFESDDE